MKLKASYSKVDMLNTADELLTANEKHFDFT